jgi:two-component system, OmpR family, phosphate regulon response regulator PhoB
MVANLAAPERVVVIDDEPDLGRLVTFNLEAAGFRVACATDGRAGLDAVRAADTAVVIVDLMLPDMLGTAICAAIRADGSATVRDAGVLMLTSRGDEDARVEGLEAGADDYVLKPFSIRELLLRVRALAKRTRAARTARLAPRAGPRRGRVYAWRGLELEVERHRVSADGDELPLRPLEFKLLATFLGAPSRMLTRKELLASVWGLDEDTETRTVDVHIRRLRAKLGAYADVIETVHGFGYRLGEV